MSRRVCIKSGDLYCDTLSLMLMPCSEKQRWLIQRKMLVEYEPRREKTDFLHMRKQRRRSASR